MLENPKFIVSLSLATIFAAVVGAVFLFMSGEGRWSDGQLLESQSAGDQVVAAIDAYQAINGRLPDSLEELVPQYLSEIPLPVAGEREWHYSQYVRGEKWQLVCYRNHDGDTGDMLYFTSAGRKWRLSEASF